MMGNLVYLIIIWETDLSCLGGCFPRGLSEEGKILYVGSSIRRTGELDGEKDRTGEGELSISIQSPLLLDC